VTNCTFSGNHATASGAIDIEKGGTVTVTNSTFSGNSSDGAVGSGGAIGNAGTLTVTSCTFSDNGVGQGGAIENFSSGTLTVANSTFAGNSAAIGGGAIGNAGTLNVTNSTFAGNRATAGGLGGAIENFSSGTLTLANAIVANSASGGNCCYPVAVASGAAPCGSPHVIDGGHNLDSDGSCGVGPATNPLLDRAGLADNGGPTQTIGLQAGSPAINDGNETICAASPVNNLDQRGYIRPGRGATNCSIGAYEFNSGVPCGSGFCGFPQVCVGGQCVTATPTPALAGGGGGGCTISQSGSHGWPCSASLLWLLVPSAVLVRRLWCSCRSCQSRTMLIAPCMPQFRR